MATPEFESPVHSQTEGETPRERHLWPVPDAPHHMAETALNQLVAAKREQQGRLDRWAKYLAEKPYVEGEENIAARPLNLMDNGKPVDRQKNDAHE